MSIPGSASPLFFQTAAAAAAGFSVNRSLRFNSADSAYLNKTFSSAGNRKTYTISFWVKSSNHDDGPTQGFGGGQIFSAGTTGAGARASIGFPGPSGGSNQDKFVVAHNATGSTWATLSSNAVFRDFSAWQHFVVAVDCSQGTASNRVKVYVNGSQITMSGTYPSDENQVINNNVGHAIGRYNPEGKDYFNGYLAEFNFIDGQALAPTDFGEFDSNSVWQPKDTSGLTFGTNGFHLPLSDNSSNAALGYDAAATQPTLAPKGGMDVVTYTGTGSTQSISGLGFEPDFVWIKSRSSASDHELYDSVRGATKRLFSSLTSAESIQSAGLTAFNSDGFTLGGHAGSGGSGTNYVAWAWKAGGAASSNTDGTITSSVSASTDYGFSIVEYTGNATNSTVGHGLNAAPKFIIIKLREDASGWAVYHDAIGTSTNNYIELQSTSAAAQDDTAFQDTAPTSSVFSIGTKAAVNNSGDSHIAYCWSEVSGFSKFGSYTGAANLKITTGFKPRFVLIKCSSEGGFNWVIVDSARGNSSNGVSKKLYPNSSTNEDNDGRGTETEINFLADGFQFADQGAETNSSTRSYIYAAFADRPGNNWDVNNLVVAAGAGNDSLFDAPTNGSQSDTGAGGEVSGNYATLNALDQGTSSTLSNGNLDMAATATADNNCASSIGMSSGKWYFEVTITFIGTTAGGEYAIGLGKGDSRNTSAGQIATSWAYESGGAVRNNGTNSSYGNGYTTGDVLGAAFDADNGTLAFYKNGVSQGTAATGLSGTYFFLVGTYLSTATRSANFGQRAFAYSAPSGYKALCTTNLPDPTIADGSDYFDAKLYTGDGANSRTISGLGFSPDFLWVKNRDNTAGDFSHRLMDAVRGAGIALSSNSTAAERDNSAQPGGGVETFTSDGFTIEQGTSTNDNQNKNNSTYVAWAWDGGSSTVSNTDGSVTTNVRANATAGFSIVQFTVPSGSDLKSYGHGLNAEPSLIITKQRNGTTNWQVFTNATGSNQVLTLNSTATATSADSSNYATSSSTFSLKNGQYTDTGWDLIAYCFAPVAGYSAFGSYVGTGTSDNSAPFVYTGFRPAFVLIKNASAAANWMLYDTARNPSNEAPYVLGPNNSDGGLTYDAYSGSYPIDILSNGFKPRSTISNINGSGNTLIYACFSEHPFKTARAR